MTILTKAEIDAILEKDKNFRCLDLSGANLTGADLTEANLTRANLTEANLTRANLTEANLYGANLYRANLTGANLYRADLTNVNFRWLASGNNKEVRTLQLGKWEVVLVFPTQAMSIGCQQHSFEDWFNFSDEKINQMDDDALKWWTNWKEILITIIEKSGDK